MGTTLDFFDIDMEGAETASGVPVEYFGLDAIKNAFKNYILSDPGDILYYPEAGGIITQILHKSMNANILSSLSLTLQRQIERDFVGVKVGSLQFIPDYEAGLLELFINYNVGEENQTVSMFFDKSLEQQPKYEYTYIDFIGENLKNFCLNKKADQEGISLGIDYSLNKFRWGDYVFSNFLPTDEYFEEIYTICNASVG